MGSLQSEVWVCVARTKEPTLKGSTEYNNNLGNIDCRKGVVSPMKFVHLVCVGVYVWGGVAGRVKGVHTHLKRAIKNQLN